MYARRFLAVLGSALVLSMPATANENEEKVQKFTKLSGDEIMAAYTDITMNGVYNMPEDSYPMSYVETHNSDSTTDYHHYGQPSYKTKGVYIISNERICYLYNHEHISGRHCFFVYQSGNCYFHYSGRRAPPATREHLEKGWISYGFKKGTKATCEIGTS